MFEWYPLLHDKERGRGILNDKQTELSGGARMKYREGNGVAEKSFVSIGEDNREGYSYGEDTP